MPRPGGREGSEAAGAPRLAAVLLDAGGTLLDLDHEALARDLRGLGVDARGEDLAACAAEAGAWADGEVRRGAAPASLWRGFFLRMLSRAGLREPSLGAFVDRLFELSRTAGLWRTPVPGGRATLRELRRRGLRLAAVSNAEGRVEGDLRAAGLRGYLEFVVDSHLVGVAKPDPEIFRIALRRLDLPPQAVVHVGDLYAVDVLGARAAGLRAVLVDRAGCYPEADCPRIRDVGELPGLLAHLGGPK